MDPIKAARIRTLRAQADLCNAEADALERRRTLASVLGNDGQAPSPVQELLREVAALREQSDRVIDRVVPFLMSQGHRCGAGDILELRGSRDWIDTMALRLTLTQRHAERDEAEAG